MTSCGSVLHCVASSIKLTDYLNMRIWSRLKLKLKLVGRRGGPSLEIKIRTFKAASSLKTKKGLNLPRVKYNRTRTSVWFRIIIHATRFSVHLCLVWMQLKLKEVYTKVFVKEPKRA